jgi:putative ABC transport system substrate-binding protein
MDRRAFIGWLPFGTLAVPAIAVAQSPPRQYRIGVLAAAPSSAELTGEEPENPGVRALLRRLGNLGYVYGRHYVTEPRGGEGKLERFPVLAAELVRLGVDVIVASGPALPALHEATSAIAVVMAGAADPVGQGFAQSLARPGRNFTGVSLQLVETTAKRLELLKELVPGSAPVAVMWDPRSGVRPLSWQAAETAARAKGWRLLSLEVREPGEIESAFRQATKAGAGALLVVPVTVLDRNARRIAELAIENRLPAMYALRSYVDAGGLISYSADIVETWDRAALFVDKILKGANPGDLPIEQPIRFELAINLKAAKAISLPIPRAMLARANALIQ